MNANSPRTEPLSATASAPPAAAADELALARYRYLLKTAAPESIEQAHAEAIAQLTPEQRRLLLQQVGGMLPPSQRALAGPANAAPQGIARLITRAELQQPGLAERLFAALPLGGVFGASLLGSVTGVVAGSTIGSALSGPEDPAPADDGDFDLGGLFDV